MAERSFSEEVAFLRLGDGDVFRGEGIVAVVKALLQSGVAYMGGYQGSPISHFMDVLNDGRAVFDELGIQVDHSANEASGAAMLGASINYPLRGAVAFKSTVGTNVASDALSNLASAGVVGGTLVILGEDYGEGSAAIQERSHAFAMKSQMWLLDPRPDLPTIARMVEKGFELSEASNSPVLMELRVRACHVTGEMPTKANRPPPFSKKMFIEDPSFDYRRVCQPPSIYAQERHKVEVRWPQAVDFIRREGLNEFVEGDLSDVGIVVQGGLFNALHRALQLTGLAEVFGGSRVPIYVLNVTYPLVPTELSTFAAGKRALLVVEEGQPAYLEDAIAAALRRADLQTTVVGKAVFPAAGEYSGEVMLRGLVAFLQGSVPAGLDPERPGDALAVLDNARREAADAVGTALPPRTPTFCTGCPERPVFSAIKLLERDVGKLHVSADVGCHSLATAAPFNIGNTLLGYGLGLAASTGVAPAMRKRVISIMGDGGFWHNGLVSGVVNHQFNRQDGILVILKNGYSSATGHQSVPSSTTNPQHAVTLDIAAALKAVGVTWVETIRSYSVATMRRHLKRAMTTSFTGLKVIIADGECQLARQRRIRKEEAARLAKGGRVGRTRFGIDPDVCTGDHSCIRLSGCPSLSIKANPDPLRLDPVATVDQTCVGCGNCGEVSHAAILCPSFYRAEIIRNPSRFEVALNRLRRRVISALQNLSERPRAERGHVVG